jgi:mRNA interferase MazF
MGRFVKGEVIVLPFPFSDLSRSKRRPALVIANLQGDDVILCMITGKDPDSYSIPLSNNDFESGGLNRSSNIRPNRIFTADSNIVISSAGRVGSNKLDQVINQIVSILQA